jgi:hypothetical protein
MVANTLHLNFSAVCFNDFMDIGKPKPHTAGLCRKIGVEYVRKIFREDALSRISHPKEQLLFLKVRRNLQGAAALHGLQSIQIQIEEHLRESVRIDIGLQCIRDYGGFNFYPLMLSLFSTSRRVL